jgi:hypothetical protein
MKLGIFLLILGLLIAGAGAYTWQYYGPTFLGYRTQEAQQFFSMGIGGMILGGGLAIGGIIRMIVKR